MHNTLPRIIKTVGCERSTWREFDSRAFFSIWSFARAHKRYEIHKGKINKRVELGSCFTQQLKTHKLTSFTHSMGWENFKQRQSFVRNPHWIKWAFEWIKKRTRIYIFMKFNIIKILKLFLLHSTDVRWTRRCRLYFLGNISSLLYAHELFLDAGRR